MTAGLIRCVQNVHIRELIRRIGWLVRMRVAFICAVFAAAFGGAMGLFGTSENAALLLGVAVFLVVSNLFYRRVIARKDPDCVGTRELRSLCLLQMAGDYLALSVAAYALGTVETPILFMVLPHIILATLFFTRRQSLLISIAGMVLVILPLLLEFYGVLPISHIFDGSYKHGLLSRPASLGGYLVLYVVCVMLCWYLASAITESLINNELELEDNYQTMVLLDEEKTKATLRGTHELKAPLAAIKSYAFTLRDGYAGPLPDKAKAVVERIALRCERLMDNITDIIRLSNLKTYVATGSQFVPVDVVAVLRLAIEELRPLAQQREIELCLEGDVLDPAVVKATEEHLRTLFANLISNAINYSRAGDPVTIRVERKPPTGIRVRVKDRGIGIPEDQLGKVFEEHFRAKNAVAHHEHGTGLGLPIVKQTARLLGAEIEVRSTPGQGSCFQIQFNNR